MTKAETVAELLGQSGTEFTVIEDKRVINAGSSLWGWSRAEAHARCARLWALRYLATDQQRGHSLPPLRAPLAKGILTHVGMAHWYELMRWRQHGLEATDYGEHFLFPADAINVTADRFIKYEGVPEADVAAYRGLALAACRAYVDRYSPGGVSELFEVVAVEQLIEVSAAEMQEVTGDPNCPPFTKRIDLVTRDGRSGMIKWRDHKTTNTEMSAKRYTLSGGVLAPEWLGRRWYGHLWGGVEINMIGWRGVKGMKEGDGTVSFDPAAGFKFGRFNLEPAPFAVARWPHDYAAHWRRLRAVEAGLTPLNVRGADATRSITVDIDPLLVAQPASFPDASPPRFNPWHYPGTDSEQACETKYGPCEMQELCKWGPPVS